MEGQNARQADSSASDSSSVANARGVLMRSMWQSGAFHSSQGPEPIARSTVQESLEATKPVYLCFESERGTDISKMSTLPSWRTEIWMELFSASRTCRCTAARVWGGEGFGRHGPQSGLG